MFWIVHGLWSSSSNHIWSSDDQSQGVLQLHVSPVASLDVTCCMEGWILQSPKEQTGPIWCNPLFVLSQLKGEVICWAHHFLLLSHFLTWATRFLSISYLQKRLWPGVPYLWLPGERLGAASQFTSQPCKAFCHKLGGTTDFSSVYHL